MNDKLIPEANDKAVQARLARLGTLPVDTAGLETRLRSLVADSVTTPVASPWRRIWRPVTALAASIAVVVAVGLIIMSLGDTPVSASPLKLAELHADVSHMGQMATPITSIAEANRILAQDWQNNPALPAVPAAQLHACCIHDFMERKIACLLLRDGDTPLTLVVGHARDFRSTVGQRVERQGRTYNLHEVNGLRMVMTEHQGRYLCLMGAVSAERLLAIAQELQF
ncbi:MAG: hypothetical protein WCJ97_03920 [Phycisphaerae bacterium]